jgi:diguanylate cyclase (GGDEF)-like protein
MAKDIKTVKHILIVDNDENICKLHRIFLTKLGYDSMTAVDGIDALEKMKENDFDIVITDLSMPRMDGIELIKRVVADFPEVDLIAITGHLMKYDYTEIISHGATDFVAKPINFNELEAKINRIKYERGLRGELEWLARRDGLTELYNRRCLDDNLKREAIRSLRQNYSLYLLFIDIDGFKAYNDAYGHQQGDNLLKQLASIISDNVRQNVDTVYRFGGDEFAIVLPHASRQQAMIVAERLLAKYNMRNLSPTSLSIGFAKFEGSSETLEDDLVTVMRKADEALYCAKSSGGNQACGSQVPLALVSPSLR